MSNPIHIIEAKFLTIGDIISWRGVPTAVAEYSETEVRENDGRDYENTIPAIELKLFLNNDEEREELIIVRASREIRVLSPKTMGDV